MGSLDDFRKGLDVGIDDFLERVAGRTARRYRHLAQAVLHMRIGERAAEFRGELLIDGGPRRFLQRERSAAGSRC